MGNYNKNYRCEFGKVKEVEELPNLIALQKQSYESFLQSEVPNDQKARQGLHDIFLEIFPVKDLSGKAQLEYHGYHLETPKFSEDECRYKGLTYSASLKLILRLIVWEFDQETGAKNIKDIKEQDVYMGEIPLMTDRGTFIINGIERVIVSQMHRSPGVFFDHDFGRSHVSGKYLFAARIVPYRGSWFDFEFDFKDIIHVRIDRRKKISLATFLFCFPRFESDEVEQLKKIKTYSHNGLTVSEILSKFYELMEFEKKGKDWVVEFDENLFKGYQSKIDILDAESKEVLVPANTRITPRMISQLSKKGVKEVVVDLDFLKNKYLAFDFIDEKTGEILLETGSEITDEVFEFLQESKVKKVTIFKIDTLNIGPYIVKTFMADKVSNREEALIDLARNLRPGEPPTLESGELIFKSLFSDIERYDLSAVGRVKLNTRLGLETSDDVRTLRSEDIFAILKKLLEIKDGFDDVDDIDNLSNRRVRAVGELIENQYRMGILRLEKSIKERIAAPDIDVLMPHDLVNAKTLVSLLREFFGTSQLSQFMDQTNPLSEVAHKRRLSALGPGGIQRERAVFEVRDVHPTHYGRICPVETPEGPNIGLINSLASYARINKYGFIETPYRKVENGKVTDQVDYLTATQEAHYIIAHANIEVEADGSIKEKFVVASKNGEYQTFSRDEVSYIDVSSKQMVSIAASLIPFLENDDANRALMGSNMQRQAVPLIKAEAPFVGTGMERVVAKDSGAMVLAKRPGFVEQVDSKRVVVRVVESESEEAPVVGVDIYNMKKFERSNMGTCLNQAPLVQLGQFLKAGDIIADGTSTDGGELALGRNIRVAFMSWNGFNFEDSIVISEEVSRKDVFTSVHIEEFEVVARDTKLGPEEITRDIPNVSEEMLKHLDESGIVSIGATVKPGDILVGKVMPKGEIILSPEEKLLRAIFGEKASDVKDSSLRVPSGIQGTVLDVRVFSRRGLQKDERSILIERQIIDKAKSDLDDGTKIFEKSYKKSLHEMLIGEEVASGPKGVKAKDQVTEALLENVSWRHWNEIKITNKKQQKNIDRLTESFNESIARLKKEFEERMEKISLGDDLAPGVLKVVKVFIAVKRKLQPGDKMAGRHGNKGVVSTVVPVEDMPFMKDGTTIDLILNPLGVPSRMNVGQVLETHLGSAAKGIGEQIDKQLRVARAEAKAQKDAVGKLREILKATYERNKNHDVDVDKMKDNEILDLAESMRNGVKFSCPVFEGPKESEINRLLELANVPTSGQVQLFDGRTGMPADRKTTVGYMYMLKLHHLVDDKMHARSIGPYSLVTQQPLGGKAQQGGQRFGEMEVWALEAYGAAYTLREMLTVKSDDVTGRMEAYDSIIRDDYEMKSYEPESFRVLDKEIRSLGCVMEKKKSSDIAEEALEVTTGLKVS
ncbi:MAG: DNA-directed RNA polymerase subunit beta [Alphaproteobacteria bacterium]|nr:MAG: DNA-directed RNA polymerase subunit beta [Alphaproteobacteria bacterium]